MCQCWPKSIPTFATSMALKVYLGWDLHSDKIRTDAPTHICISPTAVCLHYCPIFESRWNISNSSLFNFRWPILVYIVYLSGIRTLTTYQGSWIFIQDLWTKAVQWLNNFEGMIALSLSPDQWLAGPAQFCQRWLHPPRPSSVLQLFPPPHCCQSKQSTSAIPRIKTDLKRNKPIYLPACAVSPSPQQRLWWWRPRQPTHQIRWPMLLQSRFLLPKS